jgi:hypothetical protein
MFVTGSKLYGFVYMMFVCGLEFGIWNVIAVTFSIINNKFFKLWIHTLHRQADKTESARH